MTRSFRLRLALLLCALIVVAAACSGPSNNSTAAPSSPAGALVATSTQVNDASSGAVTRATATRDVPPTATLAVTAAATSTATPVPTRAPTATPAPIPTATPFPPTATTAPTTPPGAAGDFITIQRADTDEKVVALTFDAGADRGYAEQILDTLKNRGVVVTFGMTGQWAKENPDLVQRMVEERHMLMNHTLTHRSWTGYSTGQAPLTSVERADELRQTADIIRSIAGVEPRPYFRPPYGDYDDTVLADLQSNGYSVNVMWTVDSLGWAGKSADEIVRRVVDGTVPGAILLFHVGAASQDAAALPTVIDDLRAAGYRFVTIAEMVGR